MLANPRYGETKTDLWNVRAIRHLTALKSNRPEADTPEWKHDAYDHERAATPASIANDLVQATERSEVIDGEERRQLQVAKHAPARPSRTTITRLTAFTERAGGRPSLGAYLAKSQIVALELTEDLEDLDSPQCGLAGFGL